MSEPGLEKIAVQDDDLCRHRPCKLRRMPREKKLAAF
jgi:hypothetical protein